MASKEELFDFSDNDYEEDKINKLIKLTTTKQKKPIIKNKKDKINIKQTSEIISRQEIIDYIIKYKEDNNINLKQREAIKIFKRSHIEKIFKTWTSALVEAGVKTDRSSKLVTCMTCNIIFKKAQKEIEKSKNNFCSQSCSASYNNKFRIRTEEMNQKTSRSLKEYNKNKFNTKDYKLCITCKNQFKCDKKRKTCSDECLSVLNKISGTKGGLASQAKKSIRSLGENKLYNLFSNYFNKENVFSNAQVFKDKNNNYWDADIIIQYNSKLHSNKPICILYEGLCHYKQIYGEQSLKQVRSRDKIKDKLIKNNEYNCYKIKDCGRYNEAKVINAFHQIIHHLQFKRTLNMLCKDKNKFMFIDINNYVSESELIKINSINYDLL